MKTIKMHERRFYDHYMARERGYGAWDITRFRFTGKQWIPENAQALPEMLSTMASMARYANACH